MRPARQPPRPAPEQASDAPDLRALVQRLLVRVAAGARLSPLLAAAFARLPLTEANRAWATEMGNGVLRHQEALDQILSRHLARPPSALPPPVRVALRMATYQLHHMRVPAHAAVDTGVSLVAKRFGRLRGVANAVLRKVAAERANDDADATPAPTLAPDTVDEAAAALSQPAWWLRATGEQLGWQAADALARANNERPPLHLRVNPTRTTPHALVAAIDGIAHRGRARAQRLPPLPQAVAVCQAGAPSLLPGFAEGHFCVQDGAAQAVGHALNAPAGARVLDLCAAPGGKTTHLLEQVGQSGRVLAVDVHPGRLRTLTANAERLQLAAALEVLALDLSDADHSVEQLEAAGGPAPFVLLDAPCSGMGTLRRHPELRRRPQDSLASLLALQERLLDTAARVTAVGGVLVYAVCSPLVAEGSGQMEAFLARQPAFAPDPLPACLHDIASGPAHFTTWPHIHGLDGFFACRLRRLRA